MNHSFQPCHCCITHVTESKLNCMTVLVDTNLYETLMISLCFQSLTVSAMDDFNRARAYLRDMASQHNIPVYNSVDDSLSLVAQKLKRRTSIFYQVITED